MIMSLVRQYIPVVKPSWIIVSAMSKMPFPSDCSLITTVLHYFLCFRFASFKAVSSLFPPICLSVLPCHNSCSTRSPDGIGTKTVVKPHPIIGNSILVWCFVNLTSITAHRMGSMFITHNKYNVWLFLTHCLLPSMLTFRLCILILLLQDNDQMDRNPSYGFYQFLPRLFHFVRKLIYGPSAFL